jgi:hypothetical protein
MSTTITVRDETVTGQTISEYPLDLLNERVTVRELIRSRVYQEVQDYNRVQGGTFRGLVQPTDAEQTLNGYRVARPREIDWKAQFDKACEAFERNGFFVLVDDRQPDALDEEVVLTEKSTVAFVKLVPLVGG